VTRVLVVEDEESFSDALSFLLRKEGFEVSVAGSGPAALEEFDRAGADIVLLDLMLPGLSGLEVCRELRKRSDVAVVMLTAKDGEVDKVVGLELGADDYVTKPFSIRELLARVKAVLRRSQTLPKDQDRYTFGDVEVNLRSYRVLRGGNSVEFSSKEFELLKHFLCHSGETLSRDRLLEEVWGYDKFPTTRTVDAHIVRLRQKLEPVPDQPQFFLTVHGVGYRFVG
jgi:DNA-binding response OmpR family regulator